MRKEFIQIEQDKDVILEKRKDELEALSIAINENKGILESLEEEKKVKIKDLARIVKTFDDNDTLIKNRIDSLKESQRAERDKLTVIGEQVNQLIATRNEVQGDIDALRGQLTDKKSDIDRQVDIYEKELKTKSKALAKSILEQTELFNTLTLNVNALRAEILSVSTNVANGKELVKEAYKTVNELEKKENDLDSNIKAKLAEVFAITSDIDKKRTVLEILEEKEVSTERAVDALKLRREELTSKVASLEKEREDVTRDRLAFQEQKENILLKEVFIKEKYDLAGIKYE